MRVAQRWVLKDASMREEYLRRHREIWPEMKELLKKAGYRNYSIWLSGTDIFAYYEVDDPEKLIETLEASEVRKRWEDYMRPLIYLGENDIPESLEEAFWLE
ncbi:MAG: L-rhamnose mutarotase [Thermoguttaceae bacterium]